MAIYQDGDNVKRPGKLYVCKKYYLLTYETKEIIENAFPEGAAREIAAGTELVSDFVAAAFASGVATYWSGVLASKVGLVKRNEPMLFLEEENEFRKILVGEKIGWIVVADWMKIRTLEKENE